MRNATTKPLSDHFDRIFVINLRERADRRRQVAAELKQIGEVLTPGKIELIEGMRVTEADGFPTAGNRGCFLSHWSAIARAAALGAKNVLVLEDDVQFTPAMRRHGERLLGELPRMSWDIAFLGHGGQLELPTAGAWLPVTDRGFGMHCYAVHARCFDRLLQYMELTERRPAGHPEGGRLGADGLYSMFYTLHTVNVIQAWPSLATQRSSASSISPKWFDRITGLRTAASVARSLLKG